MLVIFEGIDGVGKSTQIELFRSEFENAIFTREPGATNLGKNLREILLNGDEISKRAEMFLFLADRAEHYEKVIKPNNDKLIFCDRSFISGIAYALANDENLDIDSYFNLNKIALDGNFGNKFIFFKATPDKLTARLNGRESSDKIEKRGLNYLFKVQKFIEIVLKKLGLEYLEIDAFRGIDDIHAKIKEYIL